MENFKGVSSEDQSKVVHMQPQPTSTAQDNLQRDWDQFMVDCKNLGGPDWNNFSKKRKSTHESDRVVDQISVRKAKWRARRESAKDVFKSALLCITNIGSIVSSGASTVYPASSQVYNALTFVIEALQGYWKIFEDFTAMTREVTSFLAQVTVYLKDELKSLVQDEEERFILAIFKEFTKSLAQMHALATSWKVKIMTFSKIMLMKQDNGVAGSLVEIEKLVREFTGVQGALVRAEVHTNLFRVQMMANDVSDIKLKVNDLHEANRQIKRLQNARRVLGIGDDNEIQIELHSLLSDQAIEGTGTWAWLDEQYGFPCWFDVEIPIKKIISEDNKSEVHNNERTQDVVVILKAPSGHGKTYLANRIVQYLESRYPLQLGRVQRVNRVAVTNFYFKQAVLDIPAINCCLRHIIWQLVEKHPGYLDYFERIDQEQGLLMHDTLKLWRTLILQAVGNVRDSYFYIVLDGVNMLESNADMVAARMLLDLEYLADPRLPIRIFLTGQQEGIEVLESAMRSMRKVDKVAISNSLPAVPKRMENLRNKEDLRAYIRQGLRQTFNGSSFDEQMENLQYVEHKILECTDGNYADIQVLLRSIDSACDMDAVEQAIERILVTDRRLAVEAANSERLRHLENSISHGALLELNFIIGMMLAWPQGMQARSKMMALDETGVETQVPLEVILDLATLRAGGSIFGSVGHRINSTYSTVIQLDQRARRSLVTINKGMSRILKTRKHSAALAYDANAEQQRSGDSSEITKESGTYSTRALVEFDSLQSILQLLDLCLTAATQAPNAQQYMALRSETYEKLEVLLSAAGRAVAGASGDTVLRSSDVQLLAQVTSRVLKFLRDDECVSAYWVHLQTEEVSSRSASSDMFTLWATSTCVWDWLKEIQPSLQDCLTADPDERALVSKIVEAPNLGLLLEPMAMWVAHRWLSSPANTEVRLTGQASSLDAADEAHWVIRDNDKCFVWLLDYGHESFDELKSEIADTWLEHERSITFAFDELYADLDPRRRAPSQGIRKLSQTLLTGASVGHPSFPGFVGRCVARLLRLEFAEPILQARLGQTCFRHGYHNEAVDYFRTALSSEPENVGWCICLADALSKAGKSSDALCVLLPLTNTASPWPTTFDANGNKIGYVEIQRRIMCCHFLANDTKNGILSGQRLVELSMKYTERLVDAAYDASYLIVMLGAERNWNEISRVVESLDKYGMAGLLLANFATIEDLHMSLQHAALETGHIELFRSAYIAGKEQIRAWAGRNVDSDYIQRMCNLAGWLQYYQAELAEATSHRAEALEMRTQLREEFAFLNNNYDYSFRPNSPGLEEAVANRIQLSGG